jgi:NTE family protein
MTERIKRALVLSGGGAKGAYQLGVLRKWMLEEGRDYDILCGVSVGALNVAVLSQAALGKPEAAFTKLLEMWDRVENKAIWKHWLLPYVGVLWNRSVFNSEPLHDWVRKELNMEAIRASEREVRVGVVNINTEGYKLVGQRSDNFPEFVYASAAFPFFFKPLLFKGEEWTDGGVRNVTPLGTAIELGADEIDVIVTSRPGKEGSWKSPRWPSALLYMTRFIDIMSTEIVLGDLKEAGLKNRLAELKEPYKNVKIRLQTPSCGLTGNSLDFTPSELVRMREIGYKDACEAT